MKTYFYHAEVTTDKWEKDGGCTTYYKSGLIQANDSGEAWDLIDTLLREEYDDPKGSVFQIRLKQLNNVE